MGYVPPPPPPPPDDPPAGCFVIDVNDDFVGAVPFEFNFNWRHFAFFWIVLSFMLPAALWLTWLIDATRDMR